MSEPQPLSAALAELIARRGFARVQGSAQLVGIWKQVAGAQFADKTKVIGLKRGVLEIAVNSSGLLSQLASFHQAPLLKTLKTEHPDLKIKDLRFKLRNDVTEDPTNP